MTDNLVLGPGNQQHPDAVTVDIRADNDPDVVHDLSDTPWPFDDNQFETVTANHVLEHLSNWEDAFQELHRVTKTGGLIFIRYPHPATALKYPDHEWSATAGGLLKHLDPDGYEYIGGVNFTVVKNRLHWRHYHRQDGVLGRIGGGVDAFFNIPMVRRLHTRFLWSVGGFEEYEIVLQVEEVVV